MKKLALLLALPPLPFLVLIGLGGWRRGRRGAAALIAAGVLGVWLSCTEAAGEFLTQQLLTPPAALDAATLPAGPSTAVLVLGAGVRSEVPEYLGPALKTMTQERLHYGVWLARRTGWPLGFSGGVGWAAAEQRLPEATVAEQVVQSHYGMTLSWAESQSRDTRENATNTLPLLAAAGVRRVVLVTHDSHMPRALRAFRAAAAASKIEIVPAPMGMNRDAYHAIDDWCPTVEGFARVRYAVYEALAASTGR